MSNPTKLGETVVIAVCNQKGGIGKTTVTLGLLDALERMGLRVLAIDDDPQSNLTEALQPESKAELTLNDVMAGDPANGGEVAQGSIAEVATAAAEQWGSVQYVPAELRLAAREQDQTLAREYRLREALVGAKDQWDVVIIDCPPSLGQLTISALVAADYALLVTEPRAGSLQGLAEITSTLATVRKHFNPSLKLAGVLVNKHLESRSDRVERLAELREDYGTRIIDPIILEREVAAKAYSDHQPLSSYKSKSKDITDWFDAIAKSIITTARKDAN